ncbi:MAG: isoleucine--tRNA ligase [Candidatus Pacearchaeota archaeon]|nr:isoleucine--tRNA ligase [Candidatus Pacearchaeota archaeon]
MDNNKTVQEKEQEVLKFWEDNEIYKKVKERNKNGKKFYFMDGPPYATGDLHLGTALNKILKDIAMRSKRLQGFDVFDRPGYDTHGVPIELKIEKEIGSKCKQDIEKYGVKKFVDRCKEFATEYIEVMNSGFINLGVWMDWKNPYLTLDDNYIESIWTAFKEAEKKGILFLDKYPVHICTRCETAVAFNEIEYAKQKDTSVFVKFPLKEKQNTYLIIFTTTPWTLPANTGIMVNPMADYQEVEVSEGERWIIAKDLVLDLMKKTEREFTIKEEFKGKEMAGWEYENPLSKNLKMNLKNAYRVVLSSRYVTTEEGTGLVHVAPGHGKEDYEVGKENGLDMICPVSANGLLTEETGKYAGKKARVVDVEIIDDIDKGGNLIYKFDYEHDYPLCWRCKTPLLMVSIPQWFLKISEIQEKLILDNDKVNWIPDYMKLRMKSWLKGISDWPVSRQRYWGTPLPIWYDPESRERIVVGSIKELEELSGEKNIDLHKPGIDNIVLKSKSGKELRRVPEVLDVWFDSGVSSWAALGYPSDKKKFEEFWPADLNIEGKDQFRGWWNSQMILSEISFNKMPFKNVMVHGMVLDIGKRKMSKSEGNVLSPKEIIEKYGRDSMRYYFSKISKGEDFGFNELEFKEIHKVFSMISNIDAFINKIEKKKNKTRIEDGWILSKFNSMIKEATEKYNSYKYFEVLNIFEKFLIDDLSRSYIKMIRERSGETSGVLETIRNSLLKLLSPIIPFLAESIWQELRNKKIVEEESVHLCDWPKFDEEKIDKDLEKEFEAVMKIIESGLRERDKNGIGLKWPLRHADISSDVPIREEIFEIIKSQLNVKNIDFKLSEKETNTILDFVLDKELEAEGFAREIARRVQAERKNKGMERTEKINLKLSVDSELEEMLKKYINFIEKRTGAKSLKFIKDKTKEFIDLKIKEKMIGFYF